MSLVDVCESLRMRKARQLQALLTAHAIR
jgi:hypothetical protein